MANKKGYKNIEDYRRYRRNSFKRYYDKTKDSPNRYNKWNSEEEKMVLDHNIPDSELSTVIGRSVKAIQQKRHKLINKL